jgi:two-component system phosphate regulon sensor histidine kinase PhoR
VKQVWGGAVAGGVGLLIVSLIVARFAGAAGGWGVAAAALAVVVALHLRNLARLIAWADSPVGTPVPYAGGVWSWAYAALSRRARALGGQRQHLSATLQRFLDAAQAMPDGVIIVAGAQDEIAWLNAAAESQFGLNMDRDRGFAVTNLLRQPDFVRYLHTAGYAEAVTIRSNRGAARVFSVQVIPFGDSQKLIMSRDVTHLDRLETMRRDFVANVSHELKTPLTVVRGFVETVADGLRDMSPDEAERYLKLAEEQARRMQRLVDDLLTLSQLETASPPLDEQVDVQALAADVAADARVLSAGRHTISVATQPALFLFGSARELRSAFGNLANNAVRYTPAGGTISLFWDIAADGALLFSVRDSGIGIEAHHLPRLTERFYRVDRGRSRESGGTGLGLAIVKHVLTRHQASLEIRSQTGQGSTFVAHFPPSRVASAS